MIKVIKQNKALFLLLLSFPVVLLCTMPLLPTHDDWTSSHAPHPEPFSLTLFLPHLGYWRIPEVMYGWICAHYRWLFPGLAHVLTVSGHYVGMIMIWKLCTLFRVSALSRNIATMFFLVSTGMIATITACDGMSQTWTHTLGLIALYLFLKNNSAYYWIIIILLACIIKENAMSWFFIIPFVAFFTKQCSKESIKQQLVPLAIVVAFYLTLRLTLPTADSEQLREEYFHIFNIPMMLRGIAMTIAFPLLPIDYASLLQAEYRNLPIVALSFITTIPFLYVLLLRSIHSKLNSKAKTLLIAVFLCVGIHIITIFSFMHVYSCMGMMALFIATLIDNDKKTKANTYIFTFAFYFITAVCVDAHHYKAAYDSGIMGKNIALQAIEKTKKPVKKVFIIYYDNGYKKYSNFYVIPIEAMGWGTAAQWETQYHWPEEIDNEYISDAAAIHTTAKRKLSEGFDCVWVIHSDSPLQTARGNVILDVIK